jgi:hypothetical protein
MSSLDMTVQVILLSEGYSTKTARTEWPRLGWSNLVAVFLMKSKMESGGRGKSTCVSGFFRNILSIIGWAGQWAVRVSRLVSVRCFMVCASQFFFKSYFPKIFYPPRKCFCICPPSNFNSFPLVRVSHSANFTPLFSFPFP